MSLQRDGSGAGERIGARASGPWKQMEGTRARGAGRFCRESRLQGSRATPDSSPGHVCHSRHRPTAITASADPLPRWNAYVALDDCLKRRADRRCALRHCLAARIGCVALPALPVREKLPSRGSRLKAPSHANPSRADGTPGRERPKATRGRGASPVGKWKSRDTSSKKAGRAVKPCPPCR